MKAAVLHGPTDLRLEIVADAPAPRPGEVTLDVSMCGLCGTDLHEYTHGGPMTPLRAPHVASGHVGPTVLGHEFLGVVRAVGSGVDLVVGNRVVAGAGHWCGRCAYCAKGRTNLCVSYYTYGLSCDGGLAEQVTIPAQMCLLVPPECADSDAVLAQPVAIAMHALNRGRVEAGDDVLVVGAGGIGALVVAAAVDRGCRVKVIDIDDDRLAAASRLGAAETANASLSDRVSDLAAPIVFETSGSTVGLGQAVQAVAIGGRIIAVGLPADQVPFDLRTAVIKEIEIVASAAHACLTDLPQAVDLLSRRALSRLIVSRTIPLDRVVVDGLLPMSERLLPGKVVVDMRGEHIASPDISVPPSVDQNWNGT
jgi:(R,R)-butanediol dehydrogenase / meso-butanediol dehydrogenase / diacetyl reductase